MNYYLQNVVTQELYFHLTFPLEQKSCRNISVNVTGKYLFPDSHNVFFILTSKICPEIICPFAREITCTHTLRSYVKTQQIIACYNLR